MTREYDENYLPIDEEEEEEEDENIKLEEDNSVFVNNQKTNIGDPVFFVNQDGQIYDAVIKSVKEQDGLANIDTVIDGYPIEVVDVPHNTSPEKHSWNHPRSPEEVALHNRPDFYG